MSHYYAAFLDLRGRRCLVVGGGVIAERKVLGFLESGALVRVVSPVLTADLAARVDGTSLTHVQRCFRSSDVRGCAFVVAATGVREVDDAVATAARRCRALVNVVDRPADCDFILPSVVRRGDLQIAVSTGGRSPALAREIRRKLEADIGKDYASLVERVGAARDRLRATKLSAAVRMRTADRLAVASLRATTAIRME